MFPSSCRLLGSLLGEKTSIKSSLDILKDLNYPTLSSPTSKSANSVNSYYIIDSGNCFLWHMHFSTAPRHLGAVLGCALYLWWFYWTWSIILLFWMTVELSSYCYRWFYGTVLVPSMIYLVPTPWSGSQHPKTTLCLWEIPLTLKHLLLWDSFY